MWFPMVDNEQMASGHNVLRCVRVYNGSLRGLSQCVPMGNGMTLMSTTWLWW
jgi:hypothetical protein